MSYFPRDYEGMPWVADNGLRVKRRTSRSVVLTWSTEVPSSSPNSFEDIRVERTVDGIDGEWYELQMKKVSLGEKWETVYKGYRTSFEINELVPDAIIHFRMKKNGEAHWGSTIIAATDTSPPSASDLHRAVCCNAEDMVLRIIGASKGVQLRKLLQAHDTAGMTPLMIACQSGNISIVSLLLRSGAWINAPSFTNEKTPLMHACMNGNVRLLELMDKHEADWLMQDKTGCNAFHHAINSNKLVALKYAVARCGIHVIHEKDKLGWTPLLRSTIVGSCPEVIKFLLSKGADPSVCDKSNSKSCLIAAVMLRKKEVVELLLASGADPTYKNANGQTAYDIASTLQFKEIADIIVKVLTEMASDRNRNLKEAESIRTQQSGTNSIGVDRPVAAMHRNIASSSRAVNTELSTRVIFGTADRSRHEKDKN